MRLLDERSAQDATRQSQSQAQAVIESTQETPLISNTPWYLRPINYDHYTMADPKKQEKDYTKEVDEILPIARSLATVRFKLCFANACL